MGFSDYIIGDTFVLYRITQSTKGLEFYGRN